MGYQVVQITIKSMSKKLHNTGDEIGSRECLGATFVMLKRIERKEIPKGLNKK